MTIARALTGIAVILLCLLLLLRQQATAISKGDTIHAQVTKILCGSSFVVALSNSKLTDSLISIDIAGIEAVPMAQIGESVKEMRYLPGAIEGEQALAELIKGKFVTVEILRVDPIHEDWAVGRVACNGIDIAGSMVSQGYAWVASSDPSYTRLRLLEAEAKREKRGLWGFPEYTSRTPAETVAELNEQMEPSLPIFEELLRPFKGWRLALAVVVFPLGIVVLSRIWHSSRRCAVTTEIAEKSRRLSNMLVMRLTALSIAIPAMYLTVTGLLLQFSSSNNHTNTGGKSAHLFVMATVFLPPIVIAVSLFIAWAAMVSRRNHTPSKAASAVGYAAVLGVMAGAYIYSIDGLNWDGAGDYALFAPFLLWPGALTYALFCALAAAVLSYMTLNLVSQRKST